MEKVVVQDTGRRRGGGRKDCMKKYGRKRKAILFRFYENRVSSFLSNLEKSRITGHRKDIHQLRLDMKKIMTLLALFKKLDMKGYRMRKDTGILDDLFRKSGKIRESQLNLRFLRDFGTVDLGVLSFRAMLEAEEEQDLRDFLLTANSLDTKQFEKISSRISHLIRSRDLKTFRTVADKFVRRKMKKIGGLHDSLSNERNAHKIRKHLKSAATVVSSIYLVHPDEELVQFLSDLKKAEKLIGSWHDRVVFLDALEMFTGGHPVAAETDPKKIEEIRQRINEECSNLFMQFSQNWAF
jgi:CHAD domain-containing protein